MLSSKIYKCNRCGNIVNLLVFGGGDLICCGEKMELLQSNINNEVKETHLPMIKHNNDEVQISVLNHPMQEEHYIVWIELIIDDNLSYKKFLNPNSSPTATFKIDGKFNKLIARVYCNIHGIWENNEKI